jgi:hypothetical protein
MMISTLPPEGLGTELAPTGPFFCAGEPRAESRVVQVMAWRTLNLALCVSIYGCMAPKAGLPPPSAQPAPATRPADSQPAPRVVTPFPDLAVRLDPAGDSSVEIRAWTCLDAGLLEQIACSPQTREHESLVVIKAKPSQVHAALLIAGFEPGAPGRWTFEGNSLGTVDPTGEKLAILVRYSDRTGKTVKRPIRDWIRNANRAALPSPGRSTTQPEASGGANRTAEFPDEPWIFAGSIIRPNPASMGPGEHYVADFTGSIIGLVTFGDEVIGFSRVFADQESVQAPIWEVNVETVPRPGAEVTLIVRKWKQG